MRTTPARSISSRRQIAARIRAADRRAAKREIKVRGADLMEEKEALEARVREIARLLKSVGYKPRM